MIANDIALCSVPMNSWNIQPHLNSSGSTAIEHGHKYGGDGHSLGACNPSGLSCVHVHRCRSDCNKLDALFGSDLTPGIRPLCPVSMVDAPVQPNVFAYRMVQDDGAAPCHKNNLTTLAICKAEIRNAAQPGDIIIGVVSSTLAKASVAP